MRINISRHSANKDPNKIILIRKLVLALAVDYDITEKQYPQLYEYCTKDENGMHEFSNWVKNLYGIEIIPYKFAPPSSDSPMHNYLSYGFELKESPELTKLMLTL